MDATFILALLTLTVWFIAFRKCTDWPLTVKVSVGLLWATFVCFECSNAYLVAKHENYNDLFNEPWYLRLSNILGNFFVMAEHWFISTHYLRVAVLFRLTF